MTWHTVLIFASLALVAGLAVGAVVGFMLGLRDKAHADNLALVRLQEAARRTQALADVVARNESGLYGRSWLEHSRKLQVEAGELWHCLVDWRGELRRREESR